MIDQVQAAVSKDPTIDITTTGRHSGDARRIEIWMLVIEDRFFITGTPGPRCWLANVRERPFRVVVHVKNGMQADLGTWGRVVTGPPPSSARWCCRTTLLVAVIARRHRSRR